MRVILVIGALLGVMIFGMAIFGEQKMTGFTQALFIFVGGLFFVVCIGCIIRSCCPGLPGRRRHINGAPITQGTYGGETRSVVAVINGEGVISVPTAPLPNQDTALYDSP